MIELSAVAVTSGDGLWSSVKTQVKVLGLDVPYIAEVEEDETEPQFGELRVFFDTSSWSVQRNSLIYTDSSFLEGVKTILKNRGYDPFDVSYSEAGMQGDNYVSFDVGPDFLRSWINT